MDKADANPEIATGKNPSSSSRIFYDRGITKRACDLLTPDAVAGVASIDPSALTVSNISGFCIFSWPSGDATIGHMSTSETIEDARMLFENGYRNMTGGEISAGMSQIKAEPNRVQGEDSATVNPENTGAVTGAVGSVFTSGMQFENIKGLGDIARFETTRSETHFSGQTFVSYANSLNVLSGNLKFTVSYNLDGEPKLYRDETVALAEAVLEKLSEL